MKENSSRFKAMYSITLCIIHVLYALYKYFSCFCKSQAKALWLQRYYNPILVFSFQHKRKLSKTCFHFNLENEILRKYSEAKIFYAHMCDVIFETFLQELWNLLFFYVMLKKHAYIFETYVFSNIKITLNM